MLIPVRMREINIFLPSAGLEATTVALARLEQFYVEGGRQEWADASKPWVDLADRLSSQRERLQELLDALNIPPRILRLPQQFNPTEDVDGIEGMLQDAEREVRKWQRRRHEAGNEIERLSRLAADLELIAPLEIPVKDIRDAVFLRWTVGILPLRNLETLEVRISGLPLVFLPVLRKDGPALLAAAADRGNAGLLERAMRELPAAPAAIPEGVDGLPAAELQIVREQLELARTRALESNREGDRLAHKWRRRLLALWTQASNNWRVAQAISRFDHHGDLYLISGWIPERAVDEVITTVEHTTSGRADIEILEPAEEGPRQAPTLLRNPAFLRPFQTLVTTYGVPNYNELDPTPVVALSYTVMYGMMFGDVGQGLLLALFGFIVGRLTRGTARALGAVLMIAGFSGALFGFFYGSLFGYEGILPTLWIKPLRGVLQLLMVSVAGGIAFLNLGFLFFMIRMLRLKRWGEFIFDRNGAAGLWLYWALLFGAYGTVRGMISITAAIGFAVVPAALLLFSRPLDRMIQGVRPLLQEGFVSFGIQAFFELFETVIAFVSNTISFLRLGAFAIAHAGFEAIVISLAGSSNGPAHWLILTAGTALIVALEGLVVGLQAIRLEYYEFFSRFFSGEGRPFQPLRLFDAEPQG